MTLKNKFFDSWGKAKDLIIGWKKNNKIIVFTNGCFDILHAGHIHYLREAKSVGHKLVIGLNSDQSVKILKGDTRPVNRQIDRALVLNALDMVDLVILFNEIDPLELIKFISPDVLVKGGDWQIENIIGAKEVIDAGGTVKSLTYLDGYSTSSIIDKLKK